MHNRIAELRGAQGLSQQALADALGVSRQTVMSLERSRYDPSLPLAFRLAAHFNRPIEDIFFPDATRPGTCPSPASAITMDEATPAPGARLIPPGDGC